MSRARATQDESIALSPGDELAYRYRIERRLGAGGLGTAFGAYDRARGTRIALKILRDATPERLEIFRGEFCILSGLLHPHLARVHDFGTARLRNASPVHFYASDWVEGASLDAYARGKTWRAVADVLVKTLSALDFLHRAHLRHGDVKADNVLVTEAGEPRLIDLSCAAPFSENRSVFGTSGHVAPEIGNGAPVDARADLFATGVMLKSILPVLSGRPPSPIVRLVDQMCRTNRDERPLDVASVLDQLGVLRPERLTVSPEPPRLLERDTELQAFENLLRALVRGEPAARVAWICGELGAGKTRLLNEMKWRAQLECSVVEADPFEPRPIVGMLERALGEPIADERSALFAACERLGARNDPLLLVVDDTHLLSDARQAELWSVIRSIESNHRLAILLACDRTPEPKGSRIFMLEPLSRRALADWSGELVPASRIDALAAVTGGRPGLVMTVLSELASGRISEGEMARFSFGERLGDERVDELRRLSQREIDALSLLAAQAEPVADSEIAELGLESDTLARLSELGFIRRHAAAVELVPGIGGAALRDALGPERMRSAHSRLADRALDATGEARGPIESSERTAQAILHALAAERFDRATALFTNHRAMAARCPKAWLVVAERMAACSADAETTLTVAELFETCGRPQRAVELLELEATWTESQRPAREYRLGSAWLLQGDASKARAYLERAARSGGDASFRAQTADALARAAIALGDYGFALETAQGALDDRLPPLAQTALLCDLGAAASFLGDAARARDCFERALTAGAEAAEPRASFRAHSHRAFHEYRSGNVVGAIDHYRKALEIAEHEGLDDRIANAAVSLAAAHHQMGLWAEALGSYERGLRAAVALGQTTSEVLLRFDIAKLHADIGLFDRAEAGARRTEELAQAASLGRFEAAAIAVIGEVALAEGHYDRAIEHLCRARAAFEREGALREEVEVAIQTAEAELGKNQLERAGVELERIGSRLERLDAPDVRARFDLTRGRWLLRSGRTAEAQGVLESATRTASELGQTMLEADLDVALYELWKSTGAPTLAEQARNRARERWERVGAALPDKLRDAFWRHPSRRTTVETKTGEATEGSVTRLRRLLEINKRLSASLDPNEVLERSMDAAIELSGAERGFLIQRRAGARNKEELFVSIARNIDREQIGKRHLKFSRSIAERTIASGEPIVTVDAGSDERFSQNASVHAMRLKSVVCVPIRSPNGIVGALYLDNRFRSDTFQTDDLELLLAFGDQVAIALENARLHDELARRTAELEIERKRVEELSRAQAAEIGRLSTRVRAQQEVLEHRYDYAEIVGRSPSMQAVFSTLDRVTDTSVSVLIDGESGTGKELVARAIHFNSSRRERPYVAINCGAVPASLLESELFGHARGAFTGADREREGLLVSVAGGTMFLDEIGEMPLDMQVKLLRVLQEREVRPIGSSKTMNVDFRLVCATNRRLRDEVAAGRFREDLFYRIGVVELTLPPLRDRIEDLPDLVHHFLGRLAKEHGQKKPPRLSPGAMQRLGAYAWPGNIRELENVLTRTLVLLHGDRIDAEDIALPQVSATPVRASSSRDDFASAEAEQIRAALRASRWNVSATCRALGLARSSFYRKVRRYGIDLGSSGESK